MKTKYIMMIIPPIVTLWVCFYLFHIFHEKGQWWGFPFFITLVIVFFLSLAISVIKLSTDIDNDS